MQVLNTGPVQALRVAQKNKGRHKGAVLGLVCTRSGICRYFVRSLAGRDVTRRGVCAAAKKVVFAKPFLAALHFALLRYALGGT